MSDQELPPGALEPQFAGVRERALALLERGSWGDIERQIQAVEIALALLCEATYRWLPDWENEVSPAFDEENGLETDEFELTREQVQDLGDSWRLAYVARLVKTLCLQYGLSSNIWARGPGRSPEGGVTAPTGWGDEEASAHRRRWGIAELLHGLNDLLDEKYLEARYVAVAP